MSSLVSIFPGIDLEQVAAVARHPLFQGALDLADSRGALPKAEFDRAWEIVSGQIEQAGFRQSEIQGAMMVARGEVE